jgi:hypothetical protein
VIAMAMSPLNEMPPGQTFGDTVSIAATTTGVTGTITVPKDAHLIGIDLAFTGAAGAIPTIIQLTWPNSPSQMSFVPNIGAVFATSGCGLATMNAVAIPLDVVVTNATVVTVKVTSTANVTVRVGLRWLP